MNQDTDWNLRIWLRLAGYTMSNSDFEALMGSSSEVEPKDPARHRFWFGLVFQTTIMETEPFEEIGRKLLDLNTRAAPANPDSRVVHVSIRHKRTSGGIKLPAAFLATIAQLGMDLEVVVEDLHYLTV